MILKLTAGELLELDIENMDEVNRYRIDNYEAKDISPNDNSKKLDKDKKHKNDKNY
ncbi:hypothetical protein OAQ99_04715 [Candidatus Kapabacteria bacterium]|nr:hypothetical protein [Candidatus Kapabacteria bacterium]